MEGKIKFIFLPKTAIFLIPKIIDHEFLLQSGKL